MIFSTFGAPHFEHLQGEVFKHFPTDVLNICRDMKPENVLIGRSERMKENVLHVVDFGLHFAFYTELINWTGLVWLTLVCFLVFAQN